MRSLAFPVSHLADVIPLASYVLGKLYVNNLLMIFNSRMNIVGGRNYNPTPQTNMSGNGRVNAIPLPKHYSPGSTEIGGGGYNAETGLPPMSYGRRPSDTSTLRKTPGEIEAGRQVRVDIQTAVYEDPPSSDFVSRNVHSHGRFY